MSPWLYIISQCDYGFTHFCSYTSSKLTLCWPTLKDLLLWLSNNTLSLISQRSAPHPEITVDKVRFERCIKSRALRCSLKRTGSRAKPGGALILLIYSSFKSKTSTPQSIYHVTTQNLSTQVHLGIVILGSCDSVNGWFSQGCKQKKKQKKKRGLT